MTDNKTVILWQIGREDSAVEIKTKPGSWFAEYNYTVEIDPDAINQPTIPLLIAIPKDKTTSNEIFSTGKLNIYFTLDRNYQADELTLYYGCFGANENSFLLDGQPLSNIIFKSASTELQQLEIALPDLTVGDHILTITVNGEKSDSDYQAISYLKLETLPGEDVDLLPISNSWQEFDGDDDGESLNIWNMTMTS